MTTILIITAAIFLWGIVSARLERADLTAPMVFVVVGGLIAAVGLVDAPSAPETLKPLVEVTLVWVLFSDAAGVPFGQVRRDLARYLRLLAVGLPLTVLAGWALASWFFPALGIWLTLLVAAALAPTDADLGLPFVTNPAVHPAGSRGPRADGRRPGASVRHQPRRAGKRPSADHRRERPERRPRHPGGHVRARRRRLR
jgi:NhaP-type Na+/H+ or K+/H+ antiporter